MKKTRTVLLILMAVLCVGQLSCGTEPPRVILDVPGAFRGKSIAGRGWQETQDGPFFKSRCLRNDFTELTVSSLSARGVPEIIFGTFAEPIRGRSRAMRALGTEDAYRVLNRAPGVVVHQGGPFAEFRLFRTRLDADEYDSFFAATSAGLAALQASP